MLLQRMLSLELQARKCLQLAPRCSRSDSCAGLTCNARLRGAASALLMAWPMAGRILHMFEECILSVAVPKWLDTT